MHTRLNVRYFLQCLHILIPKFIIFLCSSGFLRRVYLSIVKFLTWRTRFQFLYFFLRMFFSLLAFWTAILLEACWGLSVGGDVFSNKPTFNLHSITSVLCSSTIFCGFLCDCSFVRLFLSHLDSFFWTTLLFHIIAIYKCLNLHNCQLPIRILSKTIYFL